jgi:heme oxygenase (mycobilin-producing)
VSAPPDQAFVVSSQLTIAADGAVTLEQAFRDRLGEVDAADGFQRLEVWRDLQDPTSFRMVSWWDSEAQFRAYMGSPAHRRSHARIPRDPHAPHALGVSRFELVAR